MIESVVATYMDAAGEKQTITFTETPADLVAGGTYKFIMPENDVTVTAVSQSETIWSPWIFRQRRDSSG